ncbi:MAG: hypothetical protein KGZ37_02255 [Nitrosarchaeum sp.]|nr:hypothetical protein [Nitrosarchaeum sp.]
MKNDKELSSALREFMSGYSKLNKTITANKEELQKIVIPRIDLQKIMDTASVFRLTKEIDRLPSFSKIINENDLKLYNSISNSESSKFWKNYSTSLKETIQHSESAKKLGVQNVRKLVRELDDATKNFDSAEKEFSEKIELKDASERMQDYNRTIAEVGLTSKYLTSMALDFSELYTEKSDESLLEKIKRKLSLLWNRIKKSISTIIERMREFVLNLGEDIQSHLVELEESLSKGLGEAKNKITEVFEKISDKFHTMIEILLQKMFEFLNRFSELAQTHGFGVTKIQVKLPSIKLEVQGLFPIPIPTIDAPDVTVDISALPKPKRKSKNS